MVSGRLGIDLKSSVPAELPRYCDLVVVGGTSCRNWASPIKAIAHCVGALAAELRRCGYSEERLAAPRGGGPKQFAGRERWWFPGVFAKVDVEALVRS